MCWLMSAFLADERGGVWGTGRFPTFSRRRGSGGGNMVSPANASRRRAFSSRPRLDDFAGIACSATRHRPGSHKRPATDYAAARRVWDGSKGGHVATTVASELERFVEVDGRAERVREVRQRIDAEGVT